MLRMTALLSALVLGTGCPPAGRPHSGDDDDSCTGDDDTFEDDDTAGDDDTSPASVAMVDAGYYHSCWLRDDGTLDCWGENALGQCSVPE